MINSYHKGGDLGEEGKTFSSVVQESTLASKLSKDREFLSRTALFIADISRIVNSSERYMYLKMLQ